MDTGRGARDAGNGAAALPFPLPKFLFRPLKRVQCYLGEVPDTGPEPSD